MIVQLDMAEREFPELREWHGRSGQRAAFLSRMWDLKVRHVVQLNDEMTVQISDDIPVGKLALLAEVQTEHRHFKLRTIRPLRSREAMIELFYTETV